MLTVQERRRIRAEEEERLRVRRLLEGNRTTASIPWARLAAVFLLGAVLGFALISLYPQPAEVPRVIVVESPEGD
jgi:hypothetical protein